MLGFKVFATGLICLAIVYGMQAYELRNFTAALIGVILFFGGILAVIAGLLMSIWMWGE